MQFQIRDEVEKGKGERHLLQSAEASSPSIDVRSDVLIHAFEFASEANLIVARFGVGREVEVMYVACQTGAET